MITNTKPHELDSREEEPDITILHYRPGKSIDGKLKQIIRSIVKWFGSLSMFTLGALALLPDTFNVPFLLRPWIFLTFVFWFFAFCAGFFNL